MGNENHYNSELIERYLSGDLNDDQLREVEKRMQVDLSFKQEVEIQQRIVQASSYAGRDSLRERLRAMHREMPLETMEVIPEIEEQKVKSIFQKYSLYLAAAVIALLVVTSIVIFKQNTEHKSLFEAYYDPYPNINSRYRGEEENPSEKDAAFIAYEKGNYQLSVELFTKHLDQNKDEVALFYLGSSYLGNHQYDNAIEVFRQYIKEYEKLEPEAKWYLALALLKQGKTEEARNIFKILSETDNDFTVQASEILKELN